MAGPPVRIDGQELDVDAQLAIRLKNASGSDVFTGAIEAARARYDGLPGIIGYDHPYLSHRGRSSFPPSTATSRPPCTPPRIYPKRQDCWCIFTAAASRSARG